MAEGGTMLHEKQNIKSVHINSASHARNEARIKQDEEELKELMKQARAAKGITDEEDTEDKPSSEEPEAEPVQAEGDTEQKEEPKAEAQEDDSGLSAEEKNFKKRYGDLRRHQQKKEEEFTAKIEALEAQLTKAANKELVLPKTDEELEAWSKEYPDVASIIETIADKKSKSAAKELETRMAELEELRVNATRDKAEAELIKIHPDFIEIREDDTFHTWAEDQPKWVQDALYENIDDAKSVARVIDLYKVDKGITNKKKAKPAEKAAASSVKTKSAVTPEPDESAKMIRESEVANMTIQEYEKRADEIMEAQRSGNFIYDMTRK
tara:strand:- start:1379 stop:2350 length:972 start_codon:yes stop_codon:yes gene_type:complete